MLMDAKRNAIPAHYQGKSVGLIGMGISNRAAVDFLLSAGAVLTARDQNPNPSEELTDFLTSRGVKMIFGASYLEDIEEDILFRSPGVRLPDDLYAKLQASGCEITSEMELFTALCPANVFAVTGSDGKTTTTTLISEMLKKTAEREHVRVFLGGNIGTPLLPFLSEIRACDYVVLELSSFQLFDMKAAPHAAVITNVTPNHLNWHTDMTEYIESKKNVFANQTAENRLILNADNDITRHMAEDTAASVAFFSRQAKPSAPCCYLENGVIYYDDGNTQTAVMTRADIKLRGMHNVENYMAAIAAVYGTVTIEEMRTVARTFGGVPHRIELVAEKNGTRFYNSSIDTSPTRTLAALSSFEESLIVIVGGYDKHIPIEPLIAPLAEKAKCVVGTGDTGLSVIQALADAGFPKSALAYIGKFDRAVRYAVSLAENGDTVLLSPAAASFDAFSNFAERGKRFTELVREMIQ